MSLPDLHGLGVCWHRGQWSRIAGCDCVVAPQESANRRELEGEHRQFARGSWAGST